MAICKTCGREYGPKPSTHGKYCSWECFKNGASKAIKQTYTDGKRSAHPSTKATDAELLVAWESLENGKYVTITDMFVALGYSGRTSQFRRLKKLIGEERYQAAMDVVKERRYPCEVVRKWFDTWLSSHRPLRELIGPGIPHYHTVGKLFREYFPVEYEDAIEAKNGKGYQIGRAFEYRCRDALRAKGWVVFRSPRSKSPADLAALRAGKILLIQCKTRRDSLTQKERVELIEMAHAAGGRAILAWRGRKRQGITWEVLSGDPLCIDD